MRRLGVLAFLAGAMLGTIAEAAVALERELARRRREQLELLAALQELDRLAAELAEQRAERPGGEATA